MTPRNSLANYIEIIDSFYGNECYHCGNKENLHIHHIDNDYTNNKLDNIILLCKSCHFRLHTLKKRYKQLRMITKIMKKHEFFNRCRFCGFLVTGKDIQEFSYNFKQHNRKHNRKIIPELVYNKIKDNELNFEEIDD